jgi:Uma2 family endonuclease
MAARGYAFSMGITALKSPASYQDLLAVPDHMVAEILNGDLYASPRPALPHARAASVLGASLTGPFDRSIGGPGGWWILDEPELHLADDVLVPDLAGWRRERLPEIPAAAFLSLAPDWVSEIISPSTETIDRVKKLAIYARESVGHVWLVNPIARTLEVLQLEGGRWVLVVSHGGSDVVNAPPFEAIGLDLGALWSGTPESAV